MPEDYDRADYLTPAQVARLWGVTPSAVRLAITKGKLPALRTPTGRLLVHRKHTRLQAAGGNPDTTVIDSEK